MLPHIHAIWIGSHLGPLNSACLSSFVRTDHKVTLHSYETVADLPYGVIAGDAEILFPRSRVERHRVTGSYAPISDIIRLETQHRELGLYVDCDIYCHRPMEDADVVLGRSRSAVIGNSLMKIPRGPVLDQLRAMGDPKGWVPPWSSWKRRAQYTAMKALGIAPDATRLQSGWVGPKAMTYFVERSDLADLVRPMDVFFPVHDDHQSQFLDPGLGIDDVSTHRTHYIHVYHQDLDLTDIPPSSPIGRMIAASSSQPLYRVG